MLLNFNSLNISLYRRVIYSLKSGDAALRIHSNLDELLDAYLALRMPGLDAAAGMT